MAGSVKATSYQEAALAGNLLSGGFEASLQSGR